MSASCPCPDDGLVGNEMADNVIWAKEDIAPLFYRKRDEKCSDRPVWSW